MKKMVKILSFVLAFIMCAKTVRADVIWEPENTFYNKHWEQCEILGREFIANGPDGKVIVYLDPKTAVQVGSFENGESTWITWIYTDEDGVVWGCPDNMEKGWLPLDYMRVVYDYMSFEEDYGDRIVEESGSLDESYLGKTVYFWKYPGSAETEEVPYELDEEWVTWMPEYYKTFVDEDGRKWGFCGYYYGTKNFWVCLDAADADYEALYGKASNNDVVLDVGENVDIDAEPIVPKGGMGLEVIGVGVAVVVLATGIIIWKMKRR